MKSKQIGRGDCGNVSQAKIRQMATAKSCKKVRCLLYIAEANLRLSRFDECLQRIRAIEDIFKNLNINVAGSSTSKYALFSVECKLNITLNNVEN